MHRTRWRMAAVCAILVVALSGCFRNPAAPGLEEAIPAALLEAELGITDAWAEKSVDGFTVSVSAGVVVPDGEVTAEELRTILGIVVEHANISNLSYIRLRAVMSRDAEDDPPDVDLHGPAEELGIEVHGDADPDVLQVDWDVAVAVSTSS